MTDQEWIDAEIAKMTKNGDEIHWRIINFGGDEVEKSLRWFFDIDEEGEYGPSFIVGYVQRQKGTGDEAIAE